MKYPILCLFLATICAASGADRSPAERSYDIAAYVWPAYYPDDRAKIFWPQGIGEWETILDNKPKFPGHQQPRRPLWGYVNEADPYVMEMQIAAAADHGVNVFIYNWYWYDGQPFLEGCLNDGYLKARNNDRVKFYLMWANHDVRLIWDRRHADNVARNLDGSVVWKGAVSPEEFRQIARRTIDKYFSHPSYYKRDGKPVYMIYHLGVFLEGMGSVEAARRELDWFRAETVKAGYPGLELQAAIRSEKPIDITGVDGKDVGTQRDVVTKLGFDAITHYQFIHITGMDRDYSEVVRDAAAEWRRLAKEYPMTYHPHVAGGWDNSPRTIKHVGQIVKNNTPQAFEQALREAKAFVDARPDRRPLITINSWNEWSESSYLQPDDLNGYGFLEAVRRIFGGENASKK